MLAASYKSKGKRQRQQELFPELEKAILEARQDLKKDVQWPDQNAPAYKAHLEKEAEKLLGPKLRPRQRSTFLQKIVRVFSACFWTACCAAPRVEGHQASIVPRADAVPRAPRSVFATNSRHVGGTSKGR